jgi:NADH dehydrogenase
MTSNPRARVAIVTGGSGGIGRIAAERLAVDGLSVVIPYVALRDDRHRDLGFVVDLGGRDAVADPLGVPLRGLPAKTVTKGYHLLAMPTGGNRARVATAWMLNSLTANPIVRLGFVADDAGRLPASAREPTAAASAPILLSASRSYR